MFNADLANIPMSELMHAMSEDDGELTLCHVGVKGMKWGRRKQKVTVGTANANRRSSKTYTNYANAKQAYKDAKKAERQSPEAKAARAAKAKRSAKIGAAVVGTALAAYGTYKLTKMMKNKKIAKAAAKAAREDAVWRNTIEKAHQNFARSLFDDPTVKSASVKAGNYALEFGTRRF